MPTNRKYPGRRNDGTHYLSDRTECVRGHKFEGDNVIDRHDDGHPNGGRMCRECGRERARLYSPVRYWHKKLLDHENGTRHDPLDDECVRLYQLYALHLARFNSWRMGYDASYRVDLAAKRINSRQQSSVSAAQAT